MAQHGRYLGMAAAGVAVVAASALAQGTVVVMLGATADAFVSAANPMSNYGGGGSLHVAGAGTPNGEFQVLLRFDAASARAAFDAALGAGRWNLIGAALRLNAAAPVNPLYNQSAPGPIEMRWLQDDSWIEGTGMPASPAGNGVAWVNLAGLAGAGEESLGVYAYDGATSGAGTYALAVAPGVRTDVREGGLVTIRVLAGPGSGAGGGAGVAYLFNSRSFSGTTNRPELTLSATPVCPADFNRVDGLTVQDIFDFLGAWFAGNVAADFDASGSLAVQDIFEFLSAWFGGC